MCRRSSLLHQQAEEATAGAVRREFAEGPLAGRQVPAYLVAGEMVRGVFDESVGKKKENRNTILSADLNSQC